MPDWKNICGYCKGYPDQEPHEGCPCCHGSSVEEDVSMTPVVPQSEYVRQIALLSAECDRLKMEARIADETLLLALTALGQCWNDKLTKAEMEWRSRALEAGWALLEKRKPRSEDRGKEGS